MKPEKELEIELAPEVRAQMEADPKLAAAMKDFLATMHQAHHAVQTGQHKTIDDAIEALTGNRPKRLDPETGEEIEGASLSAHMGFGDEEDEE